MFSYTIFPGSSCAFNFEKMYIHNLFLIFVIITFYSSECLAIISGPRLTGGITPNRGHLEIFGYKDQITLCGPSNAWPVQNSEVVCRELGFIHAVTSSFTASVAAGQSGDTVYCTGNENTLSSCNNSTSSCGSILDVNVICQDVGYVGCYYNGSTFFSDPLFEDPLMTNDLCIERCRDVVGVSARGYAIMKGTQCWCERSLSGLTSKNNGWSCSILCPGNSTQSCGGTPNIFTVFRTDIGFCEEPRGPTFGMVEYSSRRYGHFAEYSCTTTYDLIGNTTIQCLKDLSSFTEVAWDGNSQIIYPFCAEKRLVALGVALSTIGAVIVCLSIFMAVCCAIRRKVRKGTDNASDTQPLSTSVIETQGIPNTPWNIQTMNVVSQGPGPVAVAAPPGVLTSRPLDTVHPLQSSAIHLQNANTRRADRRLPIPDVAQSNTTTASGDYAGIYEDLDDYTAPEEDIVGDGSELIFERHPSEEEGYERSVSEFASGDGTQFPSARSPGPEGIVEPEGCIDGQADQGRVGSDGYQGLADRSNVDYQGLLANQRESDGGYAEAIAEQPAVDGDRAPNLADRPEGNDGYLEVRTDNDSPSGDGYLEVRNDIESSSSPKEDRLNSYLEVLNDNELNRHPSHNYTYIPDISKAGNRPQLPLPLDHDAEYGQPSDYDDTATAPIYNNERVMHPRPHRPDLEQ